jgi:hypothetical protein
MVTKPQQKSNPEGAPRWTSVVGAIVAIGGLALGVFSYLAPKPETKLAQQPAISASGPVVNVSGSSNVGIGTMTGGQVSIGTPGPSSASLPSKAPSSP